jgi:hypothetical protein
MCAPPYQDFFMVVREVVLVVTGVLGVYFTLPFNFSWLIVTWINIPYYDIDNIKKDSLVHVTLACAVFD